ncbi:MAG TPA: phage holin family protein [Burkholderiales bacterium]|nr:phage holin family protein [Burkholderiales bacterium]
MRLIVRWMINALALLALPYVVSGIELKSFYIALIVAVVLGLLNAVVRPVLILLTLPVTLLTLGLFILVINALLFWFVGTFVEGFHVSGFWAAFFGAILYSLITWAVNALVFDDRAQPPVSAR